MVVVRDPQGVLPFRVELLSIGVPPVLVLSGELDVAADAQVQGAASRLWSTAGGRAPGEAPPRTVQVDLSGVSFVDVGGLRVLQRLQDAATAGGASLRWVGVRPRARWVMDLVGFDDWVDGASAVAH